MVRKIFIVSDRMNKPKVCLAVPAYRRGKDNLLAKTLDSLVNQDYLNYEIIVVDDGSSEGTWEIIQNYKQKYPKLIKRIYKNDINLGMGRCWNQCLKLADGDYINIFHSDDLAEPNYISSMVKLLQKHPDVGMAGVVFPNIVPNEFRPGYFKKGELTKLLLKRNFIICPSVFINKKVVKNFEFNVERCFCLDWQAWIELSNIYPTVVTNSNLIHYRVHSESTTSYFEKRGHLIYFDVYSMFQDIKNKGIEASKGYYYFARDMLFGDIKRIGFDNHPRFNELALAVYFSNWILLNPLFYVSILLRMLPRAVLRWIYPFLKNIWKSITNIE